ncbi:MAG TPA: DUF4426 domain-containing protein [Rhodanobacteraceae bacterium]|nr:DUF4426 domain-containing protein [Rhodanobacteraceae bacterium]
MKLPRLLAILLSVFAASTLAGEKTSGNFTIHYNALTAAALPATAAARYGISRDAQQGLLVIAVSDRDGRNVAATVTGKATSLLGHAVPLAFRNLDENGEHSSLGRFTVNESGSLRFQLEVSPQGGAPIRLDFVQDFVLD